MSPNDFLICMIILLIFCVVAGVSGYSVNHVLGFL
ncbi:hypothetical protein F975_01913 [Acinetobacter sp. ANC 3789]|nr:hypothetical protein F975_01913 [Acinetobacter sp. ANC 3789]